MVTAQQSVIVRSKCFHSIKTSPSPRSVNAARRVSRKYRNAALHKREYKKLKQVLPAMCNSPKVSKVTLIEEAIRYIDYLHAEISHRFFLNGQFHPDMVNSPMAPIVRQLYPSQPPPPVLPPPLVPVTKKHSTVDVRIRV